MLADARLAIVDIIGANAPVHKVMQKAFNHARRSAHAQYEWIMYLESNEYLCIPRHGCIRDVISWLQQVPTYWLDASAATLPAVLTASDNIADAAISFSFPVLRYGTSGVDEMDNEAELRLQFTRCESMWPSYAMRRSMCCIPHVARKTRLRSATSPIHKVQSFKMTRESPETLWWCPGAKFPTSHDDIPLPFVAQFKYQGYDGYCLAVFTNRLRNIDALITQSMMLVSTSRSVSLVVLENERQHDCVIGATSTSDSDCVEYNDGHAGVRQPPGGVLHWPSLQPKTIIHTYFNDCSLPVVRCDTITAVNGEHFAAAMIMQPTFADEKCLSAFALI
jgi:hypothetical protein